MPHVVIDTRMHRHAGIGRYITNVVPRVIAQRPDWRFTLLGPETLRNDPAWRDLPVQVVHCSSGIYSVREQLELPLRTPRAVDLFWAPHYNVPIAVRAPLVVMIHDVAHLVLRDSRAWRLRRAYARRMLAAVRRRARAVLFNSEFSRREFARYVGEPRLGEAIHLGVDHGWHALARAESPQPRPYLLFVGSIKPHKNLSRLLDAFALVRDEIDMDLVIAGSWRGQRTIDEGVLHDVGSFGSRVRLLNEPTDVELATHMAHALALVLPSLYEGFGLPALEAMQLGCPCIVSQNAALPEVCGDAAAYIDPMDPRDIASQILVVARDEALRARLAEAGRARAASFDWDFTARRTAAVLEQVMGGV